MWKSINWLCFSLVPWETLILNTLFTAAVCFCWTLGRSLSFTIDFSFLFFFFWSCALFTGTPTIVFLLEKWRVKESVEGKALGNYAKKLHFEQSFPLLFKSQWQVSNPECASVIVMMSLLLFRGIFLYDFSPFTTFTVLSFFPKDIFWKFRSMSAGWKR